MSREDWITLRCRQAQGIYVPGDVAGFTPLKAELLLKATRNGQLCWVREEPPPLPEAKASAEKVTTEADEAKGGTETEAPKEADVNTETKGIDEPSVDKMSRGSKAKGRGKGKGKSGSKDEPKARGSGGKANRG